MRVPPFVSNVAEYMSAMRRTQGSDRSTVIIAADGDSTETKNKASLEGRARPSGGCNYPLEEQTPSTGREKSLGVGDRDIGSPSLPIKGLLTCQLCARRMARGL